VKNPVPFSARFAKPFPTLAVAALFAALIAIALRIAWDPPIRTYMDYAPIGAVFVMLAWDRFFPSLPREPRAVLCDALVVGLALMRAISPPLPFVSGHTLLATYAAMTARRWPLRIIGFLVLAEVMYTKMFASGGVRSMLGGLAVAGSVAAVHRRFDDAAASESSGVDAVRQ
jgi:hypothetical protein